MVSAVAQLFEGLASRPAGDVGEHVADLVHGGQNLRASTRASEEAKIWLTRAMTPGTLRWMAHAGASAWPMFIVRFGRLTLMSVEPLVFGTRRSSRRRNGLMSYCASSVDPPMWGGVRMTLSRAGW